MIYKDFEQNRHVFCGSVTGVCLLYQHVCLIKDRFEKVMSRENVFTDETKYFFLQRDCVIAFND